MKNAWEYCLFSSSERKIRNQRTLSQHNQSVSSVSHVVRRIVFPFASTNPSPHILVQQHSGKFMWFLCRKFFNKTVMIFFSCFVIFCSITYLFKLFSMSSFHCCHAQCNRPFRALQKPISPFNLQYLYFFLVHLRLSFCLWV